MLVREAGCSQMPQQRGHILGVHTLGGRLGCPQVTLLQAHRALSGHCQGLAKVKSDE